MSKPGIYTVGWICAILPELIAAQEFLDESHPKPAYVQPNDNNVYSLGKIAQHNVVITALSDGEYGTDSASRAAANMLGSFPNIRIGLMVGIGGGAPTEEHDIRLGDIVVSAARDGRTGVFQYDFGKNKQGQAFEHTRILNLPPTLLRSAVTEVQARHRSKGHRLQEMIDALLKSNLRLEAEFKRPPSDTDRLFKAEVTRDPKRPIEDLASDANLVSRRERTQFENNPAVHYGTIASANQLMKDAIMRDKLAKEKNILCFEMECAGLMNHFPCLVIRGICDYSDTHKNDNWQGYAAMAAAAYAKDLLQTIPASTVEMQQTILDVMEEYELRMKMVGRRVEKLEMSADTTEKERILDWLTVNRQGDYQSRLREIRYEGTGQWFLTSIDFQRWIDGRSQTLVCTGFPGVGKTMITSIVIDHLFSTRQDPSVGVAYLYLDYAQQPEQDLNNLLATFLRQLAHAADAVEDCCKILYDKRDEEPRPSQKGLSSALGHVMQRLKHVFIIVDALDECQCRKEILEKLFDLQGEYGANIFVTSRPDSKITGMFRVAQFKEIVSSRQDIEAYLTGRLLHIYRSWVSGHQELLDEAKRDILEAADGVFLIARLYINLIHEVSSAEKLREALGELQVVPGGPRSQRAELLENIYAKTLERIQRRSGTLATRALLLVSCARRQMTSDELQHALAAAMIEESEVNQSSQLDLVPIERILSICLGLITVHPETKHVQLVHHTTHEYFSSNKNPRPDAEMARACVTYLLLHDPPREDECHWRENHPFYEYAASKWGHHVRNTSASPGLINKFLQNEAKVHASARFLSPSIPYLDKDSRYRSYTAHEMDALHLVAFFGLEEAYCRLIEREIQSQKSILPVRWVMKKLVNQMASVFSMTPLHYAIIGGHEKLVGLLLDHGADVNAVARDRCTPLRMAIHLHRKAIMKLLKEHGGQVETKSETAWRVGGLLVKYVGKGYEVGKMAAPFPSN
ncbi:hypothetical protein PT974_05674 [Cladobotryum mycophilum]|uniref:Nucleoside phosphorylase domain-containing protein n=1 Tax=Cladobotryum mycophilum TaxID=491253 RepID=A0ABR0SJE3_9HYPO